MISYLNYKTHYFSAEFRKMKTGPYEIPAVMTYGLVQQEIILFYLLFDSLVHYLNINERKLCVAESHPLLASWMNPILLRLQSEM